MRRPMIVGAVILVVVLLIVGVYSVLGVGESVEGEKHRITILDEGDGFIDLRVENLPTATPTPAPTEEPTATPTEEPTATPTPTDDPDDSDYSIVYSLSEHREDPVSLEGATIKGEIYAFTTPDDGVEGVDFSLDGEHERREQIAPYDFAGTDQSADDWPAYPWDTTEVSDGEHTIRAVLEGVDVEIEVTFTVNNDGGGDAEPTPTSTEETDMSISLVPTFRSIGVYADASGATTLEYRETGAASWIPAHPLMVDDDGESRGSLVQLEPNTAYDVRVDGSLTESTTTRDENLPVSDGTVVNVSNATELQNALDAAAPDQRIELAAGTYTGPFDITASGTENEPITITNDGSGEAIIDGTGTSGDLFELNGADYIHIKDLTIQNADASLVFAVNSDHLLVEDCTLTEWAAGITGSYGNIEGAVYLRNGSSDAVIRNNTIHRETDMTTKMSLSAIVTWEAGARSIIYGNTITGGFEDGVRFSPENSESDSQSRDVDIYDNTISGAFDDGISPEGVGRNVRVWNNTIKESYAGIAMAPIMHGPLYVFRNTIYDNEHWDRGGSAIFKLGDENEGLRGHKYIYHNTIYASDAEVATVTGFKQSNSGLGGVISRNNIVQVSRYLMESWCDSSCDLDYDAMYTSDPDRFIEHQGTRYWDLPDWCAGEGQGCNSIEHDASGDFADPANGDFTLVAGSPMINAGEVIPGFNDDYLGSAPDMGSLESSSAELLAPTDLVATAASSSQIDLTWTDTNSTETGYRIERSPDGSSNWSEIATVAADVESYSDEGLNSNTEYFYRIRAYQNNP